MLNVVMFGKTASQWRKENPDLKGNMRDYATVEQLLVLTNLEIAVEQIAKITGSKSAEALNTLHSNLKLPNG